MNECPQVLEQLRSMVAEVVGAPVADDEPLMAAGLDSLAAVELQARVAAAFATPLPATIALDYPTLQVRRAPGTQHDVGRPDPGLREGTQVRT